MQAPACAMVTSRMCETHEFSLGFVPWRGEAWAMTLGVSGEEGSWSDASSMRGVTSWASKVDPIKALSLGFEGRVERRPQVRGEVLRGRQQSDLKGAAMSVFVRPLSMPSLLLTGVEAGPLLPPRQDLSLELLGVGVRRLDPEVQVLPAHDLSGRDLTVDPADEVLGALGGDVEHRAPLVDARGDLLTGGRIVGVDHDAPGRSRLRIGENLDEVIADVSQPRVDLLAVWRARGVVGVDGGVVAEHEDVPHLRLLVLGGGVRDVLREDRLRRLVGGRQSDPLRFDVLPDLRGTLDREVPLTERVRRGGEQRRVGVGPVVPGDGLRGARVEGDVALLGEDVALRAGVLDLPLRVLELAVVGRAGVVGVPVRVGADGRSG